MAPGDAGSGCGSGGRAADGRQVVLAAAPLDSQARLVLVSWLCAWFALLAALMGWSVAGGGTAVLMVGLLLVATVPAAVLVRLAGLPATYEVGSGSVVVRRYLGRPLRYQVTGAPRRDPSALRLRGRSVLAGGGYGCRSVDGPAGERVHLATTSLVEVVRVPTAVGALLVTPADAVAFLQAAGRGAR